MSSYVVVVTLLELTFADVLESLVRLRYTSYAVAPVVAAHVTSTRSVYVLSLAETPVGADITAQRPDVPVL